VQNPPDYNENELQRIEKPRDPGLSANSTALGKWGRYRADVTPSRVAATVFHMQLAAQPTEKCRAFECERLWAR
jgi:hypothetical protein